MINPILTNFRVILGATFFPPTLTKKYDSYFFMKNYPFKTLKGYFYETIQEVTIPGINLNQISVEGLANLGILNKQSEFQPTTVDKTFPGSAPINKIVENNTISISFRNTIMNWMYCYEVLHGYYIRKRVIEDFYIQLIFMDSAEIPVIGFKLSDCYVSTMPGLTFSMTQGFNETRQFECGFTFNKFDVEFLMPEFKNTVLNFQ